MSESDRQGDVIYSAPSEWHWHGAAPAHFMRHIAMWEVDDDGNRPRGGTRDRRGVRRAGPARQRA